MSSRTWEAFAPGYKPAGSGPGSQALARYAAAQQLLGMRFKTPAQVARYNLYHFWCAEPLNPPPLPSPFLPLLHAPHFSLTMHNAPAGPCMIPSAAGAGRRLWQQQGHLRHPRHAGAMQSLIDTGNAGSFTSNPAPPVVPPWPLAHGMMAAGA